MQRTGKANKKRRIRLTPLAILDAINATLEGVFGLFNPTDYEDDD